VTVIPVRFLPKGAYFPYGSGHSRSVLNIPAMLTFLTFLRVLTRLGLIIGTFWQEYEQE